MSHLIVLRHGKTEFNLANEGPPEGHIIGGQFPTRLLPEGEEGAVLAGKKIAAMQEISIQYAVSSDLERAVRSRDLILSQLPSPSKILTHATPALRERFAGVFDGMSKSKAMKEYPEYFTDPSLKDWREHFTQKAPDGENYQEVIARLQAPMEHILAQQPGDILAVAHIHSIRCLLHWMLGLSEEQTLRLWIPNTTPIVIECGEKNRLVGDVTLETLLRS